MIRLWNCGLLIAALLSPAHVAEAETVTLLVPMRTIYPGELVDPSNLRAKRYELDAALIANWLSVADQAEGKLARRTLVAGRPIAVSALKAPDSVKRGEPTRALYRAPGIEISLILVPLADAPAGTLVKARNPETGAIIEAMAQADGVLTVGGP